MLTEEYMMNDLNSINDPISLFDIYFRRNKKRGIEKEEDKRVVEENSNEAENEFRQAMQTKVKAFKLIMYVRRNLEVNLVYSYHRYIIVIDIYLFFCLYFSI